MGGVEVNKIESLLDLVCQEIGGEWLLLGGALVSIKANSSRSTEDIDLVLINHTSAASENTLRANLYSKAKDLGFSPESLNSAAGFFLNKISEWQDHIIEIKTGPKGKIFRPSLTLFAVLKLSRGTDIDIKDVDDFSKISGIEKMDISLFNKLADEVALKNLQKLKL